MSLGLGRNAAPNSGRSWGLPDTGQNVTCAVPEGRLAQVASESNPLFLYRPLVWNSGALMNQLLTSPTNFNPAVTFGRYTVLQRCHPNLSRELGPMSTVLPADIPRLKRIVELLWPYILIGISIVGFAVMLYRGTF